MYFVKVKSFLAASTTVARRAGQGVVRAVFPPVCLACGRGVTDDGGLCVGCWSQIAWIEAPVCEALGTPLASGEGEQKGEEGRHALYSLAALADPPPFQRCRTAAHYKGAMRDLIHHFKFGDRLELARPMALWMCRAGSDLWGNNPLLVPVPLHRRRLWSRRYNQAALLADALAELTACDSAPLALRRIKRTRQQVGLTAEARRQNVGGAFQVEPRFRNLLVGRRVVLIDDVITTGSTVRAATRALLRGGARSVDVVALAQVCEAGHDDFLL